MKSLLDRGASDAFERARSGALFGLGIASIYVAYVLVLYLLRGSAPFEKVHSTLEVVVVSYLVLGPIAGSVVGFLLPLASSYLGSVFVATVASAVVFFGIEYASNGSPQSWHSTDWTTVAVLGLLFGILLGTKFYKRPAPPKYAHDVKTESRTVYPPRRREPEA